jgi:hypothetical protein
MKGKIDWEMNSGNEWYFVGEGEGFRVNEVNDFITSFFQESDIYMVIDRHLSYSIAKDDAATEIKKQLQQKDITLCNHSFSKMVEFNKIGVAKHGVISS